MSSYSIANYVVSIYTLFLGCVTLLFNPRARKNQLFFCVTLFSFIWLFSYGLSDSVYDYGIKLTLLKIGHLGAVLLSPAIYFLTLEILQAHKKKLDVHCARFAILLCATCAVLIFTSPLYFKGIVRQEWGYYPVGGILMVVYALITFTLASRIVYVLFQASRKAHKEFQFNDYQKFKYHSISVIIFVFAAIDYLPKFGIVFYPFGYVFVGLFSSISTYAIIRHKLFDIDIVIRRSFVYSSLIASLTVIYLSIILISERIFSSFFGYRSIVVALIASSVVALTFNPLRFHLQNLIDKYFFKIDPEKIMKENVLMKDELQKQDRLKAVSTLAAGMAHEIKNPLTAIKTFTDYLPEKGMEPEFLDRFKKVVGTEIDKIDGIVRQLLDFSKPSPLCLEKISIQKIIRETLDFLNGDLMKHKIRAETRFHEADTLILGDKKQLQQAFLNLFLNAIQAMPAGGTLTVSTALSPAGGLVITIQDTGSGIPKDCVDKIFEPFFTTKETGTGLGLSIVKGIIEEHGGKIDARSIAGSGTNFRLSFPNPLP